MPWTPVNKVLNCHVIPANLLAYFADPTRQADALLWAHGSALRPFQSITNSVANRTIPIYPAIMFASDNDQQDPTGDILISNYRVIFELMIQSSDPSTAVVQARSYIRAVTSMLLNCPNSTLAANTEADVNATVCLGVEQDFEEIRTNEMQNDFLQTVQIGAVFRLSAARV